MRVFFVDTARVNICYRPLRIAFAIHSADRASLRRAILLTHTFWGGRFNLIVFADRPEEARDLVALFRADLIVPLGDAPEVIAFKKGFPHLISPLFPDELFLDRRSARALAQVLDVQNALAYWREKPDWREAREKGSRRVVWDDDDPISDALLMQYGAYPDAAETGIDYTSMFCTATGAIDLKIDKNSAIPGDTLKHLSVGFLPRHGLRRHYAVRPGWSFPRLLCRQRKQQ